MPRNEKLAEELLKPVIQKKLKKEFTLDLKTIFGALILQICN